MVKLDGGSLLAAFVAVSTIKLLLVPSYKSTDFEVHRNWMAITHELPLSEWYFNQTSEWTLDYPPFFAFLEKFLAFFAARIDPLMVKVENQNYDSFKTIIFMRVSVMILDSILVLGSAKAVATLTKLSEYQKGEVYILLLFNSSLLLIDHIHFQYNGFLIGLLLLCISSASCKQYIRLALFFSGLVLFKHLFAPLALVFATFLVKNYCMEDQGFNVRKFGQLVLVALGALLSAFVPFLYSYGSITVLMQIMNRLFPFGRGLVHAYWAPNVWALYCFADRVLSKATVLTNVDISDGISSTSGIVGNFQMEILPTISAFTSLLMVLIFLVPAIIRIWTSRNHEVLVCVLVYSSLSTFMVGYHVHEKAILLPLFLQTLRSKNSEEDSLLYLILSAAAVTSIFPLIPGKQEAMIKVTGAVVFQIFASMCSYSIHDLCYKWLLRVSYNSLVVSVIFSEVLHPILFSRENGEVVLPFLPLMLTSVVCAINLCFAWILAAKIMYGSVNLKEKTNYLNFNLSCSK